jgi:Tol biopolymer transport system component
LQSGSTGIGNQLRIVSPQGVELAVIGQPGFYRDPRLSRDGRHLAVAQGDPQDIWTYDLSRGVGTRLTFDSPNEYQPVWSPDAKRIAFTAEDARGRKHISVREADGSGTEQIICPNNNDQMVEDWSPDGRFILFRRLRPDVPGSVRLVSDVWAVLADGSAAPFLVVRTSGDSWGARFSPDLRWVAYMSNESGSFQVYLTRFVSTSAARPEGGLPGGKFQVSSAATDSGFPVWQGDSRKLFFGGEGLQLLSSTITVKGDSVEIGRPTPLFKGNFQPIGIPYDVFPDGRRFIVYTAQDASANPITIVVNWTSGLRRTD